jgi:hypothetical protein
LSKIRNEVSNGPVDNKFEFVEGHVDVTDIASSHVVKNLDETVVDIVLVTAVSLELERSVRGEEEEATSVARGVHGSALQHCGRGRIHHSRNNAVRETCVLALAGDNDLLVDRYLSAEELFGRIESIGDDKHSSLGRARGVNTSGNACSTKSGSVGEDHLSDANGADTG